MQIVRTGFTVFLIAPSETVSEADAGPISREARKDHAQ